MENNRLVKICGTNSMSFRPGEFGDIIGVRMVTPDGFDERLCFVMLYNDGVINYIAVNDYSNYKLE